MQILLGVLVVVFLFVFRLINSSIVISVKRLQNVDEFLEPVKFIDDVEFIDAYSDASNWADENGFTKDIFFLLHTSNSGIPAKCISWWSPKYKTYLLFYMIEEEGLVKNAVDFYTPFKLKGSLTTNSTKEALLFPRAEREFVQCITNSSINDQLNRHLKSLKSLVNKYSLEIDLEKSELFPILRNALKDQADFVTSLPFWKYRGFFWLFIRCNFLKYRSY